jgi:hypothetical protein
MPENVQDPATAPVARPRGGFYISENIMKIIQGLMVTAMLGAWTALVSMYDDVSNLKTSNTALVKEVESIKAEVKLSADSRAEIQTSLTKIETELPYIKDGIDDLKSLLTR